MRPLKDYFGDAQKHAIALQYFAVNSQPVAAALDLHLSGELTAAVTLTLAAS